MVNEFAPDFSEYIILDELVKLLEVQKEGTTYSQLFRRVAATRKEKYKLATLPGTFSKKIRELEENKCIFLVRSHPRTFITLANDSLKDLVHAYFRVRKDSQIKSVVEKNHEIQRELRQ